MQIKNKGFLLGVFSVAVFVGCGKNKSSINPALTVNAGKSYFARNSFGSEGMSNLYSYEFSTNKTTLERSNTDKADSLVFQKYDENNNLQSVYYVERFSPTKLTRITSFASEIKENTSFPMNMYGMMFVGNKLIGIGYDKGEIIQTDPTTQMEYLKNTQISGLVGGGGNPEMAPFSSANTSSLLYANGKVFAVSAGSFLNKNIKPYIYQLSNDLKSVAASWPINECFNSYKQVSVLDKSKLVISCNPQYDPKENTELNLFFIDVSSVNNNTPPLIKKIISRQSTVQGNSVSGTQLIDIGGISEDKNSIFITEESYKNQFPQGIITSYWFNLLDPNNIQTNDINRQKSVNLVAGKVTYNYEAKRYLFSCYLNSWHSTCVKGKATVSRSMDASDRIQIDFNLKGNSDIKFPISIF